MINDRIKLITYAHAAARDEALTFATGMTFVGTHKIAVVTQKACTFEMGTWCITICLCYLHTHI